MGPDKFVLGNHLGFTPAELLLRKKDTPITSARTVNIFKLELFRQACREDLGVSLVPEAFVLINDRVILAPAAA